MRFVVRPANEQTQDFLRIGNQSTWHGGDDSQPSRQLLLFY